MTTTSEVIERPILFSGEMVRAVLDGRKTETRRVVKPEPLNFPEPIICEEYYPTIIVKGMEEPGAKVFGFADDDIGWVCPYGKPGDRLWVRETWQTHCDKDGIAPSDLPRDSHLSYPATYDGWVSKRRPSIHMPRWASRITLEITEIRVQRLHSITDADVLAEGVDPIHIEKNRAFFHKDDIHGLAFGELWNSINAARGFPWASNPFVWAISFKRVSAGKHGGPGGEP